MVSRDCFYLSDLFFDDSSITINLFHKKFSCYLKVYSNKNYDKSGGLLC